MNTTTRFGLALAALLLPFAMREAPAAAATPSASAEELFVRRIQPLFKEKCLACHGDDPTKIKGGLDLRTLSALLKGGESEKPAVIPGKPDVSPLYLAVTREHEGENWAAMPPKENDKLTVEQLAWVKQWILGGAPWPETKRLAELAKANAGKWSAEDGIPVPTSGGLADEWTNRKYQPENLWAYQPLKKPAVPAVSVQYSAISLQTGSAKAAGRSNPSPLKTENWILNTPPANAIDGFINQRLARHQSPPAPLADRRTLIRRVTFDLIGLPPLPNEIEEFITDPLPDNQAFAIVVERLLASPHYGEKWGQHWLDVVRYADSSGFANDYVRGNSWRYRDYVIRAFNEDKPYDQFVREQVAGDEIWEQARPETRNSEPLIAAGFLRMGPWELTGMEVPKIARQRFLDDATDMVGQVFLGHMLQCARCHDHKFDPVPTRDYYALQAVFATTQLAERDAPFLAAENQSGFAEEIKLLQLRKREHEQTLKRVNAKLTTAAGRAWLQERGRDPAEFEKVVAEVGASFKATEFEDVPLDRVRRLMQERKTHPDLIPPPKVGFEPEDYGHERIARKGLERLKWEFERYEPIAFSVYHGRTPNLRSVNNPLRMAANRMTGGELEETAILGGGDTFSPTTKVAPGTLSVVDRFTASYVADFPKLQIPEAIAGRRLALAEWITHPKHPLTARVMVNRIWQWHFGEALAGNPNNFGATGKKPTHPELLDWLAATFIEQGWSVKAMHRLILSSEAYRRGSSNQQSLSSAQSGAGAPAAKLKTDSLNTEYSSFRPRRLNAEELRDAMLRVSGELNLATGGIPARPEINLEAALQPRQVMGTFAEAWQPNPRPEQRHRRSIYTLHIRGQRDPFMEVFNSPSPDLSCEVREASTVTPQVFSLFNGQSSHDRALAFAARLKKETATREQAIERAFHLAFVRAPTAAERTATLAHWDAMTARHQQLTFARPALPKEVVREAVEENTGEKFRFTEKLAAYEEFVPDLKPADVDAATRGLAEVCLVLFNSNEFAYVY